MARPDLTTIRSPRRRIARLALAGAIALASGTLALAGQAAQPAGNQAAAAQENTPRPPEIQAVENAIRKSDFSDARNKALALIDGAFAKRDPKAAAYAAYLLAQADMYAENW
ncbi:hypothetical protein JMG10_49755, partial [Nostoc ellipsosporum NOK]|nr:hypothetical protein [Nostoc ellipsosporum NOK]